eukprot:6209664-Pleurochrysis_carterae.AAC.5
MAMTALATYTGLNHRESDAYATCETHVIVKMGNSSLSGRCLITEHFIQEKIEPAVVANFMQLDECHDVL